MYNLLNEIPCSILLENGFTKTTKPDTFIVPYENVSWKWEREGNKMNLFA